MAERLSQYKDYFINIGFLSVLQTIFVIVACFLPSEQLIFVDIPIMFISVIISTILLNYFMPHIRYLILAPNMVLLRSFSSLYRIRSNESSNTLSPDYIYSEIKLGICICGVVIVVFGCIFYVSHYLSPHSILFRVEILISLAVVLAFYELRYAIYPSAAASSNSTSVITDSDIQPSNISFIYINTNMKNSILIFIIVSILVILRSSCYNVLTKYSSLITIIITYLLCLIVDKIGGINEYYGDNDYYMSEFYKLNENNTVLSYTSKSKSNFTQFFHYNWKCFFVMATYSIIHILYNLFHLYIHQLCTRDSVFTLKVFSKYCIYDGILMIVFSVFGLIPCTISSVSLGFYCNSNFSKNEKNKLNIYELSCAFLLLFILSFFYPIISFLYYSPYLVRSIIFLTSSICLFRMVFHHIFRSKLNSKIPQPLYIASIIITFGCSFNHIYCGDNFPLYIPNLSLVILLSIYTTFLFPIESYPLHLNSSFGSILSYDQSSEYVNNNNNRNSSRNRSRSRSRRHSSSTYNKRNSSKSRISLHEVNSPSARKNSYKDREKRNNASGYLMSKDKFTHKYVSTKHDSLALWNQDKDKEVQPIIKKDVK